MSVREAVRPAPAQQRPERRPSLGERLSGRIAGGAPHALGLTAASLGTTWFAMWSWRGFTTQAAVFLGPLFLLALVVGGLGVALRLARVPVVAAFLLQAVGGALAAQALITGYGLPSLTALDDLRSRLDGAFESAQAYAAPVPADAAGVEPLLILGGLACLLLVDLMACSLRWVSLAGLPLLVIYTIPVSMTGDGVSWWLFVVVAAGFAAMLFLQESEHVARWGRTLGQDASSSDPSGFGVRTGDIRGSAAGIAALATAVALVVPMLIPTVSFQLFSGGFGSGSGDDLTIENPVVDLRRDLQRGEDIPIIDMITTDPDPSYLRIAVLKRLGGEEWSPGDREVPYENLARGELPLPPGVTSEVLERSGDGHSYQVTTVDGFHSKWLPTSQNVSEITSPGDWRYDETTMDFLAGQEGLDASDVSYQFTKLDLQLDANELLRAPSSTGALSADYTFLPSNLPDRVREIARQVTDGYTDRYSRAVRLQQWFREDGDFTYSVQDSGSGTNDLLNFLEPGPDGRIGYCEQFASAFAILARTLGIPSRVSIGFLRPEEISLHRWRFSSHDLHAWPELYFPGSGWVRFEPTPAGGPQDAQVDTQTPAYTQGELIPNENPTPTPGGVQPTEELPSRGDDGADADPSADESGGDESGVSPVFWWSALGVGIALLLVLLAFVPQLVRRARRSRRWRAAGAAVAWAELRDTAVDLGIPWHPGLSPRAMGNRLVEHFGAALEPGTPERPFRGPSANPRAAAALDRLVREVEQLRYARPGSVPAGDERGLRFDTDECVAALVGGASRSARRRAHWLPRSLVNRPARKRSRAQSSEPTLDHGVLVDHVG